MNEPENQTMTVTAARVDLSDVEDALVRRIIEEHDPRPSTVIPVVAREHPGADVRGAYWRLVSRSVVVRELNGHLAVPAI